MLLRLHTGALLLTLFRLVVLTPVPLEQVGAFHIAYNGLVAFLTFVPPAYVAVVALLDEFQPINTLAEEPEPFVMLHDVLCHDGTVQVLSAYVHVTLPSFVLDAPPHVPVPPFFFNTMVLSATVKLYVAVALL